MIGAMHMQTWLMQRPKRQGTTSQNIGLLFTHGLMLDALGGALVIWEVQDNGLKEVLAEPLGVQVLFSTKEGTTWASAMPLRLGTIVRIPLFLFRSPSGLCGNISDYFQQICECSRDWLQLRWYFCHGRWGGPVLQPP